MLGQRRWSGRCAAPWRALKATTGVRVIVLTGAGRGFCAGADISLLSMVAGQGVDARVREQALRAGAVREGVRADFQKKYSYFPAVTKPVVGAINGPVVGLGLVITLYDIRFASDAARFGTAFSRRGLIAEYGLAWLLPRIVGLPNALELLFSAAWLMRRKRSGWDWPMRFFRRTRFKRNREYARDLAANVDPHILAGDETPGVRGDVPDARGSV